MQVPGGHTWIHQAMAMGLGDFMHANTSERYTVCIYWCALRRRRNPHQHCAERPERDMA